MMPGVTKDQGAEPTSEDPGLAEGLEPGRQIGDLTLERELGRGAQGVVFSARQASLNRSVAVKILPREITFNQEQIDRFRREASAAGRLSHPNIVAVYGFHELDGHRLIAQELVHGGSLEDALEERFTRQPDVDLDHCRWAARTCGLIARALQHAHDHDVVHRDIKPGNVLLTEDGAPKIADFGLAKVEDGHNLSRTGTLMGTPNFMSPEQVSPQMGEVGPRTDVYSLGALLYRMLTGRVAFQSESLQGLLMDILTREPKPLRKLQPGIPADLEAVCLKALRKSPENRYGTAADFAEDLERFLRDETTVARPVGPLGHLARSLGHLATSTLSMVALLVPTAWFGTDMVLRLDAADDVAVHGVRLIWSAVAAVVLLWPLSLLTRRLFRARTIVALPVAVLLVAAGGLLAAWRIVEERDTQLHHAAREALTATVALETLGDRIDTLDVQGFVEDWEPRFEDTDTALVARAYFKRRRPIQAESWVRRLSRDGADTPPAHALQLAIHDALGADDLANEAEARLWAAAAAHPAGDDWTTWQAVGDILRDVRRFADARRAFERAARLNGADRDRLNLDLARVSADLCQWESAVGFLDDFVKWNQTNPTANRLAYTMAQAAGDHDEARVWYDRLLESDELDVVTKLQLRFEHLKLGGDVQAIGALVRETRARADAPAAELDWAARSAATLGKDAEAAGHFATSGNWFLYASEAYGELLTRPGWALNARVGLSMISLKRAPYDPEHADELRDQAIAHATAAVELDPLYWQAHYNLGLALRLRALADRSAEGAELQLGDWHSFVDPFKASLSTDGLQPVTLNDTAYSLGMLYRLGGDKRDLALAQRYIERAIRLNQPPDGGVCELRGTQRQTLSACYDTQRELHELGGDLAAALGSAESARDVLGLGDPRREARVVEVERLAEAIAAGG